MTPEREAQMHSLFEKWIKDPKRDVLVEDVGSALAAFLACARALEPMVREETFDAAIEKCEEWAHHLSQFDAGKSDVAETCAEMIRELKDAAMSAALEDGNANH